MKTVLHAANTRGGFNHGWLNTRHTFSFADYFDRSRMHFGVLRVINDDIISGGMGFGTHPHDNMEIITIPLGGALQHRDSMGNGSIIHHGDIQVMSAGSGITHSEFNANSDEEAKILQIWVFPNKGNVTPRYQQLNYATLSEYNKLQQILSPNADDAGVWIHQDAWFSIGTLAPQSTHKYDIHKSDNGVYAFIISGKVRIGDVVLEARDGLGLWDCEGFDIEIIGEAHVLLMEVPMQLPS